MNTEEKSEQIENKKKKSKNYAKSEKIRNRFIRTFYYAFCITFIIAGLLAIIYFVYCQDKNIFGQSTKYYEEAQSYYAEGNLAQAEASLYSCIDYDQTYSDARELLIKILLEEEKYDEAVILIRDGITLAPRNETYYIQNIQAMTGQNKIREALDFIDSISSNYMIVKLGENRPSNFVSLPDAGTYDDPVSVLINVPSGSRVYYTLDGSDPSKDSILYGGESILIDSGTKTIRAFAIADNGLISDEYSATYRIYRSSSVYEFADSKMEKIVRENIGKKTGNIIYSDLSKITTLKDVINGVPIAGKSLKTLSDIVSMENINSLELTGETDIESFSVLSSLTNIKSLKLSGCNVSNENLDVIGGMTWLENLDLSDNKISDISALASLTKLKTLNLANNNIKNIDAIGTLTKITVLNISNNRISSVSSLKKLSGLENLNLSDNPVSELDGISSLSNITTLNLARTEINTLGKISSYRNLINLDISGSSITGLKNITSISSLSTLNVSQTGVKDFSSIKNMRIKNLTAVGCNLSDLSSLASVDSIESLNLSDNVITDLSPLTRMTNLTSLNIKGNFPTNISVLAGCSYLRSLNCSGISLTAAEIELLESAGINIIRTVSD